MMSPVLHSSDSGLAKSNIGPTITALHSDSQFNNSDTPDPRHYFESYSDH